MDSLIAAFTDPTALAALIALVVMEVVLGIDNLVFISILTNKLPEAQRPKARRIGIGLALAMRLVLLSMIATKEIHHNVDPTPGEGVLDKKGGAVLSFGSAITQIILLDMVFSLDSILTAVGMTDNLAVMYIAVIVAVTVMLIAADPLGNFIARNPTVVMLALGFLLMIGAVLIADGFGVHVPKGYIYAAMAFSTLVEVLNIFARRAKLRKGEG